jgi:hypothetical protein
MNFLKSFLAPLELKIYFLRMTAKRRRRKSENIPMRTTKIPAENQKSLKNPKKLKMSHVVMVNYPMIL